MQHWTLLLIVWNALLVYWRRRPRIKIEERLFRERWPYDHLLESIRRLSDGIGSLGAERFGEILPQRSDGLFRDLTRGIGEIQTETRNQLKRGGLRR